LSETPAKQRVTHQQNRLRQIQGGKRLARRDRDDPLAQRQLGRAESRILASEDERHGVLPRQRGGLSCELLRRQGWAAVLSDTACGSHGQARILKRAFQTRVDLS